MDHALVVFKYLPSPAAARGGRPCSAGGAAIVVSAMAAAAIHAHADPNDGELAPTARRVLERIDEREAGATELALLVRALARRRVWIRVLKPETGALPNDVIANASS